MAISLVPLGDPPLPPLETATLVAIYTGLEVGVTQGAWKSMAKECLIARGEGGVTGEVPLENEFALAEGRVDRNTDMQELQNGVPGVAG